VYAKVVLSQPTPALQHALFQAHWTRAEARTAHGLHSEALLDWEQALNLAPSSEKAWVRVGQLLTKARYGEVDDAVKGAEEEIEKATKAKSPEAFYQLARVFAAAAGVEAKKTGDGADAAKMRAEEFGERAVQLLDQAKTLGHFANADRRRRLTDDSEWQPIRGNASFQALLRGIQTG